MEHEASPWDDVPSTSQPNTATSKAAVATDEENTNPSDQTSSEQPSTKSSQNQPASTSTSSAAIRSAPSKTRAPRRHGNLAQSTTLETLDDSSMGPLGPLGMEPAEETAAPAPPVKELPVRVRAGTASSRPGTAGSGRSSLLGGGEEGAYANGSRAPGQLPGQSSAQTRPLSTPIEQAAKPSFNITVGDPHTVGGTTSSHTVYTVVTKTTSKAYNTPTFTVTRRYRDFLWLYERLHDNNPGVVVPPPPDKQAVGRFEAGFVESRRMALERMISRTAAHPILQHDGDLKTFLESEAFNVDIKHKDRAKDPLLASDSGASGGGFMSTIGLGGRSDGGGKFVEHDDWFFDRKIYLETLETQLRALLKSVETVIAQRKALSESCGDFSTALHGLANVELSPSLSGPLEALGDLQLRIQELYSRQAMQDFLTLGIVIEEYIRLIASVQKAFLQRQRAYHAWHAAEQRLVDIRKQHEKLLRSGRSQQERMGQMQADVGDQERRVNAARVLFEDLGRLMRGELERFEGGKVEDFKSGVETFLEVGVEAQKELIELWETYLLQLDSDEDGPPLMPAGVQAHAQAQAEAQAQLSTEPTQTSEAQARRESNKDLLHSEAEVEAQDEGGAEAEGRADGGAEGEDAGRGSVEEERTGA